MSKNVQNTAILHNSILNILKSMISKLTPAGTPNTEIDALMQICVMGMIPTGDEKPKELMRSISDKMLDHLISNMNMIQSNPITGKVGQFFLIEWCYRNEHLYNDWTWVWDSANEGRMSFDPKIPLDQLVLPSSQSHQ
jgi:hypothetical protein